MKDFKEYIRTLDDEIDWKVIDQLHSATSNFSSTSLEIKKLFFVLVGIAVPSLIKLAGDKLDISFFVTFYILILTFWFLDSFTYFYQEKLRGKMDERFIQIKRRHKEESFIITDGPKEEFTIEITRTSNKRFWRSIFNSSLRIYWILLIINSFGTVLFITEKIQ